MHKVIKAYLSRKNVASLTHIVQKAKPWHKCEMYFCFLKQLLIVYRSTKLQKMWQLNVCICTAKDYMHKAGHTKKKDYQHFKSCLELWKERSIHTQECSMMCYNTTGKRKLTFLYKTKFNGRLLNMVCTSCVSHYKAKTVNFPEFACRVSG